MNNDRIAEAEAELRVGKLRRLYYWLSYHRFTGILYGGLFFIPWLIILGALIAIALVFTPFMLFVLYKEGKRGWLIFFFILVGVPAAMTFISTGSLLFDRILDFVPFLTYFFYCYLLRLSVREWISDATVSGGLWMNEEERPGGSL